MGNQRFLVFYKKVRSKIQTTGEISEITDEIPVHIVLYYNLDSNGAVTICL